MAQWQGFYDELASARYPALLAYAITLTGNRAAAEDVVQDALVRTFGKRRKFDDALHAERYVKRAIASVFIDGQRRRLAWLRAAPKIATPTSVEGHAVASDTARDLGKALAALPPQVRVCVVLHYYDDLTVAEVARTLGLRDGTVKRYLSDGREALRHSIGPMEGHGETDEAVTIDRVPVDTSSKRRRS